MSKFKDQVIVLDRGNYTTCTVYLHGGTILSYRVRNTEMLYMKQRTIFNNILPIRGGIKFTFPYFGKRINGPKHGFARYVPWKLESGPTTLDDGNVEAVFYLEQSEYTKAIWNYKFKLSFKLTLCINCLVIAVKVENTSSYFPFLFNLLRHSIFKVEDVKKVEVLGLSKCQFFQFKPNMKKPIDPDPNQEKIVIDRRFWNVYLEAPPVVEVHNINDKGLKIRITVCDSSSPDAFLYNPWTWDEKFTDDYYQDNPEEYLNCLGVGSGHIHGDIRLEPKGKWESKYIIEVVDEQYDKKIQKLLLLLNDPWELFKDKCFIKNTS